tara:strand:+ start:164 stop:1057 length:894 start_codon:yes stop_codon:yes gene_type:complete
MKSLVQPYNQSIYVNGTGISGISSIEGSYGVREQNINVIGFGYVTGLVNTPLEGRFNIQRKLISEDPFLNLTGDGTDYAFSGTIFYEMPNAGGTLYNQKSGSFGFHSGYLNSYKISCSIGEIPTVSTSISVFGDLGTGVDARTHAPVDNPQIKIPNQGSISLSCNGSSSNNIVSFEHEISVPRNSVYSLGTSAIPAGAETNEWPQRVPSQVDVIYPIETTTNFTMLVDDYETKNLYDSLTGVHTDGVSITINDEESNNILTFDLSNARLISENIITTTDQPLQANLTYKKYINKTGR